MVGSTKMILDTDFRNRVTASRGGKGRNWSRQECMICVPALSGFMKKFEMAHSERFSVNSVPMTGALFAVNRPAAKRFAVVVL